MVHAKSLEEKFVADGFGTERIDLMYNDFCDRQSSERSCGRDQEGLKIAGTPQRLRKKACSLSVARTTQVLTWRRWIFGKTPGIKPSGVWYQVFEKGSIGKCPDHCSTRTEKAAYTVIDRATFLTLKDKIKLVVLVEKDEAMLNFISLIPVNPQKFPK